MFLAGFCTDTKEVWGFAGKVVTVFKILIPIILVILGIIALGKAVIAADDKEIKSAVTSLIKKFIAAVCIFFIPTIIRALFSFVGGGWTGDAADYTVCIDCITGGKC